WSGNQNREQSLSRNIPSRFSRIGLHDFVNVGLGKLQGRKEAEKDAGENCEYDSKGKHVNVNWDVESVSKELPGQHRDSIGSHAKSDDDSQHSAGKTKNE